MPWLLSSSLSRPLASSFWFRPWLLCLSLGLLSACASLKTGVPAQPGPFAVGVQSLVLPADHGRSQAYLWYPADSAEGLVAMAYSEGELNQAMSRQFQMPGFLFDEVPSQSYWQAPVASGSFPLVIFNHGWQAYSRSNMSTFEYLAARGIAVLSLAHPGDSIWVEWPDGQGEGLADAPRHRPEPARMSKGQFDELGAGLAAMRQASSYQDYDQARQALAQLPLYAPLEESFDRWYDLNLAWLDALEQGQVLPQALQHALDLEQLHSMGHSFGGMVAGLLASNDARIRSAVVLDAPQLRYDWPQNPGAVPVFYAMASEINDGRRRYPMGPVNQALAAQNPLLQSKEYPRSRHMNFTDLAYVGPLRWFGLLGKANSRALALELNQDIETFIRTAKVPM